eukprot:gene24697-31071_t
MWSGSHSARVHYAMKIQKKASLLETYRDSPRDLVCERQAFSVCQHPFIVNLDYAFQTDTLAIMVLGLATAGDLHIAQCTSPTDKLSEERVRFYAAEIVLALSYMHSLGLAYRDLKPENVLLNVDGHVQLVDLGGVMDANGTVLSPDSDMSGLLPLFSPDKSDMQAAKLAQNSSAKGGGVAASVWKTESQDGVVVEGKTPENTPAALLEKKSPRHVIGTLGYMAPEMVFLLHRNKHFNPGKMYGDDKTIVLPPKMHHPAVHVDGDSKLQIVTDPSALHQTVQQHHNQEHSVHPALGQGGDGVVYNQSVDWWSLGVTMFKLLTGVRPFTDESISRLVDMCTALYDQVQENIHSKDYVALFQKIDFPPSLSPECQDLITRLLDVNDKTRLGCGPTGDLEIRSHPFFASIDWDDLEHKHTEPPHKPDMSDSVRKALDSKTVQCDLSVILKNSDALFHLDKPVPLESQQYFSTWDFTSSHTIRVEAGLAKMMDQYDRRDKVRRLMGDKKEDNVRGSSPGKQKKSPMSSSSSGGGSRKVTPSVLKT